MADKGRHPLDDVNFFGKGIRLLNGGLRNFAYSGSKGGWTQCRNFDDA